jgi:UDP-N-acetylmuramoyl-tripeptide--D-alanyl-D-alanine ligase
MDIFLDNLYLLLARIYLAKGSHKTVVVTGSVGKTSTTQAIATTLSGSFRVMATKHNFNTHRGVPLTVFGLEIPLSRFGWLGITVRVALKAVFTRPKFDMLVLELGSDKPGDVAKFAFLSPDIAVVTAVTPEHMEYFKTIDAIALEELSVSSFAPKVLVNSTLITPEQIQKYAVGTEIVLYSDSNNFAVETTDNIELNIAGKKLDIASPKVISVTGSTVLLVSALVAKYFGVNDDKIISGLQKITPVPGRMSKLSGKNGSVIIDDTYNSSPEAVRVAMDYFYAAKAKTKIAVLGMMNEMGEESERLHRQVGSWCEPAQIDLLVTLGDHANLYLAAEAEKRGCKVVRTNTPYEAGALVLPMLDNSVMVLAKGSQNKVYLEEAVKMWLADPTDESRLTRQYGYWPAKKSMCFERI